AGGAAPARGGPSEVRGGPMGGMRGRRGGRGGGSWALRREYRSTYRDTLVNSEVVTTGRFWGEGRNAPPLRPQAGTASDPVEISIDQSLAAELGVALGDAITWDVQGAPVVSRVTSLREVDWARFEPNFFVVFHPGALERAPQSLVTLTRITDPAARGALQRRLAERFPNVTTVDLSLVQQALEALVDRVTLAVRFMALFSLVTGGVVLVASVRTSRFARLREGALLKTLGATRRQVLRVAFAEYLSLGTLATLVALGLASGAGWAIARWVFEQPFAVPVMPFAILAVVLAGGTVLVGLANSLEVVRKTPLAVLRGE
ncbi:MAG: FtsX-like permease family protein, partial [Gemmatimonadales bacterium]|nr:FtsX-like permease family protein [Gemmatimonadales bacterium]